MSNWIDENEDLVLLLVLLLVLGTFQVCFWTGVWYISSTVYYMVTK